MQVTNELTVFIGCGRYGQESWCEPWSNKDNTLQLIDTHLFIFFKAMQKVQVQKFSVSLVQYEEKKDFNT